MIEHLLPVHPEPVEGLDGFIPSRASTGRSSRCSETFLLYDPGSDLPGRGRSSHRSDTFLLYDPGSDLPGRGRSSRCSETFLLYDPGSDLPVTPNVMSCQLLGVCTRCCRRGGLSLGYEVGTDSRSRFRIDDGSDRDPRRSARTGNSGYRLPAGCSHTDDCRQPHRLIQDTRSYGTAHLP